MKSKTFYMSEDINLILNGNSLFENYYKNRGLVIPDKSKLSSLRDRMKQNLINTYGNVEVIPEQDIYNAMQSLAQTCSLPLISLDEIYLKNNPYVNEILNISRIKIGDKTFMSTRSSEGIYLPFEKEISRVCDGLKDRYGRDYPHRSFAYWWCSF